MATYKIGTWELHVHSGRAQIKKERRRQMENAKRSEHQKTIYFSGADVSLELLASQLGNTRAATTKRTASKHTRSIYYTQDQAMTQIAHIAKAQIFAIVLQRRPKQAINSVTYLATEKREDIDKEPNFLPPTQYKNPKRRGVLPCQRRSENSTKFP